MKEKNLMKSIISSYAYVNRVIKIINKNVLYKGINSCNTYGFYDTLSVMNEMAELVERKRKLQTLKELTEDCLKSLPEADSKVLILKFVEKFSNEKIGLLLNKSSRTVCRLFDKALLKAYDYFCQQGFNYLTLTKFLKSEKWILNRIEDSKTNKLLLTKTGSFSKDNIFSSFVWN